MSTKKTTNTKATEYDDMQSIDPQVLKSFNAFWDEYRTNTMTTLKGALREFYGLPHKGAAAVQARSLHSHKTDGMNVSIYSSVYNFIHVNNVKNTTVIIKLLHSHHTDEIIEFYSNDLFNYITSKVSTSMLQAFCVCDDIHRLFSKCFALRNLNIYNKINTLKPIRDMIKDVFIQHVYSPVKDVLKSIMFKVLDDYRIQNETRCAVNNDIVGQILSFIQWYSVCDKDEFGPEYMDRLANYYSNKSAFWMDTLQPYEYIHQFNLAYQLEIGFLTAANISNLTAQIETILVTEFLDKHMTYLIEHPTHGFVALWKSDNIPRLASMYRALKLTQYGVQQMAHYYSTLLSPITDAILNERGIRIKNTPAIDCTDIEYVRQWIDLYRKYADMNTQAFDKNPKMCQTFSAIVCGALNQTVGTAPSYQLMVHYCDTLLRVGGIGNEKYDDDALVELFNDVVGLTCYLRDKDMFGDAYRLAMAKRLLSGKTASDDMEKVMLGKLKMQYGTIFTSKMENMVNDLNLSRDIVAGEYAAILGGSDRNGNSVEMTVQLLSTGTWPAYKALAGLSLPTAMSITARTFEEYYLSRNGSRKLTWIYSLGTVNVRATYPARPPRVYEFVLAPLQIALLWLFQGKTNSPDDAMSFSDIVSQLGVSASDVNKTLHSLTCGKFKLLSFSPPAPDKKTVSSTDTFILNTTFSCPMKKIVVPMAALNDDKGSTKVEEDRSFIIDAAIVRIMKSRKSLKHQDLIAEILNQLVLFSPDPKKIKMRIESLIERGHLERNADEPGRYDYLA